jgi:hypothetical protein
MKKWATAAKNGLDPALPVQRPISRGQGLQRQVNILSNQKIIEFQYKEN